MRKALLTLPVLVLALAACVAGRSISAKTSAPNTIAPQTTPVPPLTESTPAEPEPAIKAERVKVTRVIDGDTIQVTLRGASERVRFIGMDTPERGQTLSTAAEDYTAKYAGAGKRVWLELDLDERDRYGRLLAYVWLSLPDDDVDAAEIESKMLNARLLTRGLAVLLTIQPNSKYVDYFKDLQSEARTAKLNLWKPTPKPKPKPKPSSNCHPNYKGACLDPNASDYDCAGGSGDGPKYVEGPVYVEGDDPYDLDRDNDGVGCDS